MLSANTLLQNRYLIVRAIGQGGMGAVYEAIDERLGNKVALKETFFTDETLRNAFQQEARLLAGLRHPALPKVSDHFTEGNGQFLVMEYIPGDDLWLLLQKHSALPIDKVLLWSDKLLDALDYLHLQEPPIVHRDIKPQNLKLTPRGEIILLDFGLAKTTHSIIAGYTKYYAPLEQIQGSGTDARSDLYALAATIYHLLTGEKPPDVLHRAETLLLGKADPLQFAHQLKLEIPPSIGHILTKAMSLNRDQRYPTAAIMRAELAMATQPTLTPSKPPELEIARPKTPEQPDQPPIIAPPTPAAYAQTEGEWNLRYRLMRLIGEGGMGASYQALDQQTGKIVCIKRLKRQIDERTLQQECRALARLKHNNIVTLLDFDVRLPDPYLVMEFIDGPMLSTYLSVHKPLTEPVVLALAKQLFEALEYAHNQLIIHCDLKPANILLERNGSELRPKILDYGLSIVDLRDDQGNHTALGRVAGTIEYMAPEQFEGVVLKPVCDIYAIGQIMWEMLAGRPAFSGSIEMIIQTKRKRTNGLDIYSEVSGISESLARLIKRCTHRDPAQRPEAQEALTTLNEIGIKVVPPVLMAPLNTGFDLPEVTRIPFGWHNSVGFVDGVSAEYDYKVIRRQDKSAFLQMETGGAGREDFGSLMQRCPAYQLAGRTLRLTGRLRTRELSDWAGLWLRLDGERGSLFFENMSDRPVRGTTDWHSYSIETKLPAGTRWLNFGILMVGHGTLWADDIELQVFDEKTNRWHTFTLWSERGYPTSPQHFLPIS